MIEFFIREWQVANREFITSLMKYQRAHENSQRLGRLMNWERANLFSEFDVAKGVTMTPRRSWQATDDRLQAHFGKSDFIRFLHHRRCPLL